MIRVSHAIKLLSHASHTIKWLSHPGTLTKIFTVRLNKKTERSIQRSAEEKLEHTIAAIDLCPHRYPTVPTSRMDANVHSAKWFYKIVVHDRMPVAVSTENLFESENIALYNNLGILHKISINGELSETQLKL